MKVHTGYTKKESDSSTRAVDVSVHLEILCHEDNAYNGSIHYVIQCLLVAGDPRVSSTSGALLEVGTAVNVESSDGRVSLFSPLLTSR